MSFEITFRGSHGDDSLVREGVVGWDGVKGEMGFKELWNVEENAEQDDSENIAQSSGKDSIFNVVVENGVASSHVPKSSCYSIFLSILSIS